MAQGSLNKPLLAIIEIHYTNQSQSKKVEIIKNTAQKEHRRAKQPVFLFS
jgi:hypothetical protein